MMKQIFTILILTLCAFSAAAQRTISGSVVDNSAVGIEGAFVALVETKGDKFVNQTVADSLGKFAFEGDFSSNISLVVSSVGYRDTTALFNLKTNNESLPPIILAMSQELYLDDVVVERNSFSVKQTAEGIVFKVADSVLIANNKALGIIGLAPLLNINYLTGDISMLGKSSVDVYINSRKSRMSMSAFKAYMEQLDSNQIESIEILTNPGSEYNVDFNTGVVNLKLKRNEAEGVRGSVQVGMVQTKINKQSVSGTLNYAKNKFDMNIFGQFMNYGDYKRFSEWTHYLEDDYYTSSEGRNDGPRQQYDFNVNSGYQINDKQSINATVNFYGKPGQPIQEQITKYGKWGSQEVDSIVKSEILRDNMDYNISANVNYIFKTDERGSQFKIDGDYLHGEYQNTANYIYTKIDEAGNSLETLDKYSQVNPQISNLGILKSNYSYNAPSGHNIGVGVEGSLMSIDYKDSYSYDAQYDSDKSSKINDYHYNEKRAMAYVSHSKQWSDKFNTSVEARIDYSQLSGSQIDDNSNFSKDYLRIHPSLSLSYSLTDKSNLSYYIYTGYSMPNALNLNPFTIDQSQTYYLKGNPELDPSKNFSQYLTYSHNSGLYVSFSHSITDDAIEWFEKPLDDSNIIEKTPVNYGRHEKVALNVNYNLTMVKSIWYMKLAASVEHNSYKKELDWLNFNGVASWFVAPQITNTVTLSAKHRLQLVSNLNYFNPYEDIIRKKSSGIVADVRLTKQFDNLSLSLYGYNFWTQNELGKFRSEGYLIYSSPELYKEQFQMGESFGVIFNATYNFGRSSVKTKNRGNNTDDYNYRLRRD